MVNNKDVIVLSDDDEHMSSGDDGDNNGGDNISSGDDGDNNYSSSDDGDDNMSSGDDGDNNYSGSDDDDNMSSGDDGENNFSSSDDDENISSGDDDNISTSDDDDKVVYTVRAPNIKGRRKCLFDHVSIFANYMRLNPNQVQVLNNHANDYPVPPIKHYVFKMTNPFVVPGKSKMFSNDYLNKFLDEPIEVVINCNRSEEVKYVRMKKGEKKGKIGNAMMTTGWKEVVEEFDLRKGDICAFSFRDQSGTRFQDVRARLRLLIVPLDN
jgi:hypothetical protein